MASQSVMPPFQSWLDRGHNFSMPHVVISRTMVSESENQKSKGYRGISQICRNCSCHAMRFYAVLVVMPLYVGIVESVNTCDVGIAILFFFFFSSLFLLFGKPFGELV